MPAPYQAFESNLCTKVQGLFLHHSVVRLSIDARPFCILHCCQRRDSTPNQPCNNRPGRPEKLRDLGEWLENLVLLPLWDWPRRHSYSKYTNPSQAIRYFESQIPLTPEIALQSLHARYSNCNALAAALALSRFLSFA
jgi:hypothetical protein